MNTLEAIQQRHSVRSYLEKAIPSNIIEQLEAEISKCNKKSGLHIQLITNEPNAFNSFLAHYGKFRGVTNYIALIGSKSKDLEEKAGYYGEHLVLKTQQLGLNTCWVALTFSKRKSKYTIHNGEKLVCVIALGYGETQGVPHKSKEMASLCDCPNPMPDWFQNGMKAALLAPTATNQQKFLFSCSGSTVTAKSTGGFYSKVDLGIVKYHFEVGAGQKNFQWK